MANHPSERRLPTARQSRAVAVVLATCALLMASIPSAIAKSGHAKTPASASAPSAAVPAESTASASTPSPSPAPPASEASESSPASETVGQGAETAPQGTGLAAKGHLKSAGAAGQSAADTTGARHAAGSPAGGGPQGASHHEQQGARRQQKQGADHQGAARGGKQDVATAQLDAVVTDAASEKSTSQTKGTGKSAAQGKSSSSGQGKGSGKGPEHVVRPHKPHVPKGSTGKAPTPPVEVAPPGPIGTVAPPATEGEATGDSPTSSPASTPVAEAASVSGAPTPAAGATVAVSGSSAQARRPAAAAHARARAHRVSSTGLAPAAVAALAAAGSTPAGTTHVHPAGRTAHAPRHSAASRARSSRLVTTITRIVGVVPSALWILIGLLAGAALALAARSRVAASRARRLERQRGQLLEDVGLLQAALLPVPPARLGPVGTSAAYRPADGPGAGGDFYDVFALEGGQLGVILGDISGHGRQALPHTALVRFTLRAYLEAGLSPRAAMQTAGAVLEHQLGGSFATVVAATYDPRERILVYASAGHPSPIMLGVRSRSQPAASITACSAPPIGVGMRTGTRQTVVSVPGQSQLCFYTDGVTEARVGADLFGPERLARTIAELGPEASASALLDQVAAEVDRRPDDMAACLLSVEGGAEEPRVLREELELEPEEATSERTTQFLLACGLRHDQVLEITRSARLAAGRTGTVSLAVDLADGRPRASLQHDNVALLRPRLQRPRAALRVSR